MKHAGAAGVGVGLMNLGSLSRVDAETTSRPVQKFGSNDKITAALSAQMAAVWRTSLALTVYQASKLRTFATWTRALWKKEFSKL